MFASNFLTCQTSCNLHLYIYRYSDNSIKDQEISSKDLQETKAKMKEKLDKDLKNITKLYNLKVNKLKVDLEKKKETEVAETKRDLEAKYRIKFNELQTEINRYINDADLEKTAKSILSEVKSSYEEELNNLQNLSDAQILTLIEAEKEALRKELEAKHEKEVKKLEEDWNKQMESVISEVLVDSAVKSVSLGVP